MALRVPKTAELVADSIRGQIVRGELSEGDTLPAEADLTQQYGISRPTLREALRILESEALITVSRGARAGAQVHRPSREVAARYVGLILQAEGVQLADLYEARVTMFAPAARALAERGRKSDVKVLRKALDQLAGLAEDAPAFLTAAAQFNVTMLELTGNRTLTVMAGMLGDVVDMHLRAVARDWLSHPARAREAQKVLAALDHLIGLIETADGEEAETFWAAQMRQSARYSLDHYGPKTVVELLA
ncbi:MAG: FadR family transcriptional regulator [Actinobacteria bacterium]|nr:FadR family transcriptional regulator [Actinomycetota bacterium]